MAGAGRRQQPGLAEQLLVADAMVLGRKTYEGLAAVWPTLADDPAMGEFADRINSMPKYVASRSLSEPLAWNATLLEGDLSESVPALKERHGLLVVSGAGLELEAIAAVVIGGTLLSGGAGSLTGRHPGRSAAAGRHPQLLLSAGGQRRLPDRGRRRPDLPEPPAATVTARHAHLRPVEAP